MLTRSVRRVVAQRRRRRFDTAVDNAVGALDGDTLRSLMLTISPDATDYTSAHHRLRESFLSIDDEAGARLALTRAAGPENDRSLQLWPGDASQVAGLDIAGCEAARRKLPRLIEGFVPAGAVEWWQRALIAALADTGPVDHDLTADLARPPDWQPIAVAGAGWSGSGAVFDYLRSADQICPVKGEGRLLEGRHGILRLIRQKDPDIATADRINLLRYSLLGFAPCEDWNDFRHVHNARRSSCGPGAVEFARLSATALAHLATPEARCDVPRWGRSLFDGAIEAQLGTRDVVPLLDNVVHIRYLDELAGVVPHVSFIAVTRDPRDQYLDNLHSNPRFNPDIQRFITKYRRVRALLDSAVEHHPNSVTAVQFEQFVLDPETRRRVTAGLIDRIGGHDLEASFDQARSARNTGLWRSEREHPAVAQIARQLPEFLID